MVQNVPQQQQDHHQSRLRRLMSAPTIEAIAQTVEEVGKEHASSTGQGPKTDHNAQAAIGTWSSVPGGTFERRCVRPLVALRFSLETCSQLRLGFVISFISELACQLVPIHPIVTEWT